MTKVSRVQTDEVAAVSASVSDSFWLCMVPFALHLPVITSTFSVIIDSETKEPLDVSVPPQNLRELCCRSESPFILREIHAFRAQIA